MNKFDIERSRQARKTQDNIKQAVELIFNEINYSGNCDNLGDLLIKEITSQHRTLQQDFWRTMFGVINGYGALEYKDARNEAAVEACQDIARDFEHHLPRI